MGKGKGGGRKRDIGRSGRRQGERYVIGRTGVKWEGGKGADLKVSGAGSVGAGYFQ